jgi:hypothetical protein
VKKDEEEEKTKPNQKKTAPIIDYSNMKGVLLRNVATDLCADLPTFDKGKNESPVNQFDCDGSDADNQIWDFEVRAEGKGPHSTNLFQIRNRKDGLCMDLRSEGGAPGGEPIQEYSCKDSTADNQLWWLEQRDDKRFWIHNFASDQQCLQVKGPEGTGDVNAALNIEPCRTGDDHEWTFW